MKQILKEEKGVVLLLALLFMSILFAVMTAIIFRQSAQWTETRFLSKRNAIQQCADLAYEIITAVLSPNNYSLNLSLVVPGMRVMTGHVENGVVQQVKISPVESNAVGGALRFSLGGLAGVTAKHTQRGAFGLLFGPAVTCIVPSGNSQAFTEIEMMFGYQFGM